MTGESNIYGSEFAEAVINNPGGATRTIRFETGRLAKQAAGSVTIYQGDTLILSAATASKRPKDNLDFFPLTVDVEERMYAAGRIPGSFFRREGRPVRGRDPHLPPDRPAAAPVVQEGPAQRDPDRLDGPGARPRPPVRRAGDQLGRLLGAAVRPAVHRPGRRHPRRQHQRRVGRLPDPQRARGRDVRHGRRRPDARGRRRRDHDGRGRGHQERLRGHQRRRRCPHRGHRGCRPRGRQARHRGGLQGAARAEGEGSQGDPRLPGLPRLRRRRAQRRHRRCRGRAGRDHDDRRQGRARGQDRRAQGQDRRGAARAVPRARLASSRRPSGR